MNTRRVNGAAGVILAALQQNRTPAGIALALESAGLLMTPEMADDMASVSRDAVAVAESSVALMKREHAENTQLRAELNKYVGKKPTAATEMVRADHFSEAARLLEAAGYDDDAVNFLDNMADGIRTHASGPDVDASVDKLTRLLAPTQALREVCAGCASFGECLGGTCPNRATDDEDPCHPCGCPKRHARHADGCPTYSPATGCGDGPNDWCPGCSACKCEPHNTGCMQASTPR